MNNLDLLPPVFFFNHHQIKMNYCRYIFVKNDVLAYLITGRRFAS